MQTKKHIKKGLLALVIAVALVGAGYGMSSAVKTADHPAAAVTKTSDIPMVPANFSDLAEKVRPGVVNIQVVKSVKNAGFEFPFPFRIPENPHGGPEQQGVGSGFVISADGYILTNNHVVHEATEIKVKLADGKEYDAKVVGRDLKTDLALLKAEGASGLHALQLGDSDSLKVGNWVVAVGSPFGLEQTVTAGIVSAKGRVIGSGPYDNFIQTDASINPGNSGGPLLNMEGEVVGINTAIFSQSGGNVGIGFAIPVNMAKEIAPQLKEKGHVTRGWLGVGIQKITPELAKSFGLKEEKGALVSQVVKSGPADKGGLETGDVIVEFDGKKISDSNELPRMVASIPIGKAVSVKVLRAGSLVDREVKIGEMEEQKEEVASVSTRKPLGMSVQNITPEIAKGLGLKSETGILVARVVPGSPAAKANIRSGDVIQQVNKKPVKDVEDFKQQIENAKDQETILLLIQRGESTLFAALTPGKV
ncbi:MAG: DegQ family serine endoprotease [Deltaproteobacteria bacterium]|jgi:serine protease Do|nr:DegQ family serine endoprotease [Deltaproteobacteria bacterium]